MTGRRLLLLVALVVLGSGTVAVGAALARSTQVGKDPVIGRSAPALAGPTLDGGHFTLRPGHAVTVVNIWASWCGPCREELPLVARLAHDWKRQDVRLVTVSTRDGPVAARTLLHEVGVRGLLTVSDPSGGIAVDWGATGVPETFVVDADGVVRARQVGAVDESWLRDQVRRWADS